MQARIYHNPRCSKSRATLALLEERGVEPDVVEYLETPPTADELRELLAKLGLRARDLIRKGETEFKDSGLSLDAPEDELIELMAAHPILIERPIVVVGGRARLGRPPEQVLELLEHRTVCPTESDRGEASSARREEGAEWAPATDEQRGDAPQIGDPATEGKPFGALE